MQPTAGTQIKMTKQICHFVNKSVTVVNLLDQLTLNFLVGKHFQNEK